MKYVLQKNKTYEIQKKSPPKINISGDSLVSNLEVVETVGKLLNKDFNYKLVNKDPERPGHDIKYGLDTDLIKDINGHFDTDFEKGIKQTVDWFLKNKSWLEV